MEAQKIEQQDRLVPLKQAARALGIAEQTARNWLLEGKFPIKTVKLGYLRMVKKSDLDRYLAGL